MTQQLTNLTQRRTAAKQIGGKGMAEQVSPFEVRGKTGPIKSAVNNAANRVRPGKPLLRSLHPNEHPTRRTRGTDVTKIARQCRANLRGHWQAFQSLTFASNNYLAVLPVQIVQRHRQHLAAPQPESGQEQQDRIVALAGRCAAIAAGEQSFNLIGKQRAGQM
ncbi:hypothetical protein AWB81_08247 [Caballeronia arationis]|nr:hypothetical protein AWB81_08247 [Caballeronia arationis]